MCGAEKPKAPAIKGPVGRTRIQKYKDAHIVSYFLSARVIITKPTIRNRDQCSHPHGHHCEQTIVCGVINNGQLCGLNQPLPNAPNCVLGVGPKS